MTTLYKLTEADGWTRRAGRSVSFWREGSEHSAPCVGELKGPGFIHAFESPLLAVLLNPFPRLTVGQALWEAEGKVAKSVDGLLLGCRTLTTHRQIPLPDVTPRQRAAFAVLCTLQVCQDRGFGAWAKNWLEGRDDASAEDIAEEAALWAEEARVQAEDHHGTVAERSSAAVRHAVKASRGRGFRKLDLLSLAEQAMSA